MLPIASINLSAIAWLALWEAAQQQSPNERTLALLALVLPEHSRKELMELSLGQISGILLKLREQVFGNLLASTTLCPYCQVSVEIQLDLHNFYTETKYNEKNTTSSEYTFQTGEFSGVFRILNQADKAAIAGLSDIKFARQCLAERCLLGLTCQGEILKIEKLPEEIISALAEALSQADPLAEIRLDLSCPACSQQWTMGLDIAAFFWEEMTGRIHSLLNEIHQLAWAYGWSEADILTLSDARRKFYLNRIRL